MTQSVAPASSSPQILREYLRSHGKRCTPERFMILEAAERMQRHFTVDSLCNELIEEGRHVATATVYSTLQLLVECGLVKRLRIEENQSTYYEADPGNHLHLICTTCGKIKDVRDPALDDLIRARRFTAFSPSTFSLSVYGVCSSCTRKRRKSNTLKTNQSNKNSISKNKK
ncbi:MAG: transcriptional repressor [Bacteroidales bacterium]|nr:transcriptional repressor [Bacteroidales bacterium]